jgi:hypothetical protein
MTISFQIYIFYFGYLSSGYSVLNIVHRLSYMKCLLPLEHWDREINSH